MKKTITTRSADANIPQFWNEFTTPTGCGNRNSPLHVATALARRALRRFDVSVEYSAAVLYQKFSAGEVAFDPADPVSVSRSIRYASSLIANAIKDEFSDAYHRDADAYKRDEWPEDDKGNRVDMAAPEVEPEPEDHTGRDIPFGVPKRLAWLVELSRGGRSVEEMAELGGCSVRFIQAEMEFFLGPQTAKGVKQKSKADLLTPELDLFPA